ncbi:protein FANTASTIC FOUR 3-like [Cucurbita pepo subsp. pepo]|uniref:protein FANTASTIC FOUR 3-like n=1 Tax=Cucurbita pepo subsp. pepo TaxID=3664 RepID=UPI000C9D7BB3|nr:protein FANTASTIC FOUR 3-like [Cucurbita pepo subsp. pepo]
MAVCKSLHPIFETPLPENQTLRESLTSSWTQSVKPVEQSLQLCTEGLGSESSDDVENENENWEIKEGKVGIGCVKHVASRMSTKALPPPLSFMGRSGKGGVCFMSYREDGRLVLKEVRIGCREFVEARREDGRLKLQIVQPNQEDEDEEHDDVEAETPSSFVV